MTEKDYIKYLWGWSLLLLVLFFLITKILSDPVKPAVEVLSQDEITYNELLEKVDELEMNVDKLRVQLLTYGRHIEEARSFE